MTRRNQNLSHVAAILGTDGGVRVVVAKLEELPAHKGRSDTMVIVPGLRVQEPVPHEQIPGVIKAAHAALNKRVAPVNPCGDCRECCVTPYIAEINKPSHRWCSNCDTQLGCMVQFRKPRSCASFECEWLKSQRRNYQWSEELRPDKSGVMFTGPETGDPSDLFYVHRSAWAPDALSTPVVARHIAGEQAFGRRAKFVTHYIGEKK